MGQEAPHMLMLCSVDRGKSILDQGSREEEPEAARCSAQSIAGSSLEHAQYTGLCIHSCLSGGAAAVPQREATDPGQLTAL